MRGMWPRLAVEAFLHRPQLFLGRVCVGVSGWDGGCLVGMEGAWLGWSTLSAVPIGQHIVCHPHLSASSGEYMLWVEHLVKRSGRGGWVRGGHG